jgi:hypothetical protein
MSAPIPGGTVAPAAWPFNADHTEVVRQKFRQEITIWVGNIRLADAMERETIARLEGAQRHFALSKSLIPNAIRWCRQNPRASAAIPMMIVITLLCDNNDGWCWLTIKRMAQLFCRTERSIRECIDALENDGILGVDRKDGLPSRYWPKVPGALADVGVAVASFVDALSDAPKARIYPATQDPGTIVPPPRPDPGTIAHEPRNSCARTPEQLAHSISLKEITKDISRPRRDQPVPGITASRNRNAKQRTELSESWKPTPEMVTWAKAHYVATDQHVAIEAEKFQAHHIGRGNTMADWAAAWHTWWLNGYHKIPRRLGAAPGSNAGQDREFADAFERARQADEEAARCRR